MKIILCSAALLAGFASVGFGQVAGSTGNFTLALTVTSYDATKNKESKPFAQHQAAIAADADTTYTESWGTKTQKIGNRDILQAMFTDIAGWSLVYVESENFDGVVAFKNGAPAVAVPRDVLELGNRLGGVESGKYSSKYTAAKNTEGFAGSSADIDVVQARLFDIPLRGLDKSNYTWKGVQTPGKSTYEEAFSGKVTLTGGEDDVVIEGTASYTGKSAADVSAYLPR